MAGSFSAREVQIVVVATTMQGKHYEPLSTGLAASTLIKV